MWERGGWLSDFSKREGVVLVTNENSRPSGRVTLCLLLRLTFGAKLSRFDNFFSKAIVGKKTTVESSLGKIFQKQKSFGCKEKKKKQKTKWTHWSLEMDTMTL